jgi:hypothetical protein
MRVLILILLLGGCATVPAPEPADAFFARLGSLCGKAYAGRVVSTDAADADMRGKPLVMHVRDAAPRRFASRSMSAPTGRGPGW